MKITILGISYDTIELELQDRRYQMMMSNILTSDSMWSGLQEEVRIGFRGMAIGEAPDQSYPQIVDVMTNPVDLEYPSTLWRVSLTHLYFWAEESSPKKSRRGLSWFDGESHSKCSQVKRFWSSPYFWA